jgi:hypothetical protein
MRRLPVVPATHEQIRKLELVLDAVPVGMLGGQCYDPVGRAIIDSAAKRQDPFSSDQFRT